ncbi:MAG: hypothetical protein ACRDV3_12740 [Acidothermaceae bacterium]
MNALVVAAADPNKNPDGAMGLLVFLVLAVAVVFLLRSMNRHLRKVRNINFDDTANSRENPKVAEPRKPGAN